MEEMPVCKNSFVHMKICSISEDCEFSSSVDPKCNCGDCFEQNPTGCKCFSNGSERNCKESSCNTNDQLKHKSPGLSDKSQKDDINLISSGISCKDDLQSRITPCRSSNSDGSLSYRVEEPMDSESEVTSSNLPKRPSVDVVITKCEDNVTVQSPTAPNKDVNIPDKIAECLIALNSSTSSPAMLLQPDRRGRYRHRSGGWIPDRTAGLEDSVSRPRLRLSRDHIQPSAGSLSELHGSPRREVSCDEEEEEDMDEIQPLPRARSSTCPEIKAFKRKIRVRMMNRPPTPPPGECLVKRLSPREGSSENGSQELLDSSEDVTGEGRMGVRFSLDSQQDESVSTFTDDWGYRRQSETCVLDLPIIEETA